MVAGSLEPAELPPAACSCHGHDELVLEDRRLPVVASRRMLQMK